MSTSRPKKPISNRKFASLVFGSTVGGFIGLLLAVPVGLLVFGYTKNMPAALTVGAVIVGIGAAIGYRHARESVDEARLDERSRNAMLLNPATTTITMAISGGLAFYLTQRIWDGLVFAFIGFAFCLIRNTRRPRE